MGRNKLDGVLRGTQRVVCEGGEHATCCKHDARGAVKAQPHRLARRCENEHILVVRVPRACMGSSGEARTHEIMCVG